MKQFRHSWARLTPAELGWAGPGLAVTLAGSFQHFAPWPHDWVPRCSVHAFTGLHCPGCGAWRALGALAEADVSAAAAYNSLLVLTIPVLLLAAVGRCLGWGRDGSSRTLSERICPGRVVLLLVISFFLLRNIPVFPLTLLAPGGPATRATTVAIHSNS